MAVTFRVELGADSATVRLEMLDNDRPIGFADLPADELDGLIQTLGQLRAEMSEEVPNELEDDAEIDLVQDPVWSIEPKRGEVGRLLSLRHPGFGWLRFELPDTPDQNEARSIAEWLTKPLPS